MFSIGEYVVYGTNGICQITDIKKLDLMGANSERDYYVLQSTRGKGSQSFVPVDSDKVSLRLVIDRQDAKDLIEDISMIDGLGELDDKSRENRYKEIAKECECRQWIAMIKTIYIRKQERLAQGKKMTATDERYMRLAQDNLFEELCFALDVDKNVMEEKIFHEIQLNS